MFYSFVFSVPILNVALIKNAECTHFKSTKYTVYSEKKHGIFTIICRLHNSESSCSYPQSSSKFWYFLVFPTCSQKKITLLLLILKLLRVSGSFCSGSLFWIHLKPFQLFFCLKKGKILVNFRSGTDSCIQA